MEESYAPAAAYPPIRLPLVLSFSPWRAILDLAAIAFLILLTTPRGGPSFGTLEYIVGLLVFAAWRLLSAGMVQFDSTGITVSDQYWRLLGNVPIKLHDPKTAHIQIESAIGFPVVWINGVRIVVNRAMLDQIRRAANMLGASCANRSVTLLTLSPIVLIWLPFLPILFMRGATGYALAGAIYLAGSLVVLIPFLIHHGSWPRMRGPAQR